MKIKKRTFYIVLLFFLLSLLVLIFIAKGNRILGLNKYGELREFCSFEVKNFQPHMVCVAFLEGIEVSENNTNCLRLKIVNDDVSLENFKICEESIIMDTTNPLLTSEMLVPVQLSFEYTYSFPPSYELEKINIEVMEDSKTLDILRRLNEKGVNLFNIRTNETLNIEQKGYYFAESKEILPRHSIGIFTIAEAQILEKRVEGEEILLKLKAEINKSLYEIEIQSLGFTQIENQSDSESKKINASNISEIELNKNTIVVFMYIPPSTESSSSELNDYCKNNNFEWRSLCDYKSKIQDYILEEEIDKYISENIVNGEKTRKLDKLMLNYLIYEE